MYSFLRERISCRRHPVITIRRIPAMAIGLIPEM
jgi:hypothetical protein